MTLQILTQEKLKKVLTYNPETGLFVYRANKGKVRAGAIAGSFNKSLGYLVICIDYERHYLHRLAYLYMEGTYPDQIDHINHNKIDNRWSNIRSVTHKENGRNVGLISTNTSGFCGVTWDKANKKWQAAITVLGKSIKIGRFADIEDAIINRKNAEKKYGFHENHGS